MRLKWILALTLLISSLHADNQTDTLSSIESSSLIPFTISIELADFTLPNGVHSYAQASYKGKWLILAGRTNGLHFFNDNTDNFPPSAQNLLVYVIDPLHGTVATKSLNDPTAHLSQFAVDALSSTSPQSFQSGSTLYVIGGYGVDSSNGTFSTKPTLTAIDIPGLIHWVTKPSKNETAKKHIRQITHPLLQVTGGYLSQVDAHAPFLLIFGQNFKGYYFDSSNGDYTEQVRRLRIIDDGSKLAVAFLKSEDPNPNYRRRDLNVVPVIQKHHGHYDQSYMALSGVFTESAGAWTVPVTISGDGKTAMADPNLPSTFKQGMNNYVTANLGLFSKKSNTMYVVLAGGITFLTDTTGPGDPELPFTNIVTTLKIASDGTIQQCLMDNSYPDIPSPFTPIGAPLRFGAGAGFFLADDLPVFPNGVFSLDDLQNGSTVLGYIVGGIESAVANTSPANETMASPYVFRVILTPTGER